MKDTRYYNETNKDLDHSRHVLSNGNVLYEFEGFDMVGARALDGANLLCGFLCSNEHDNIPVETYSRRVPGRNAWEYTILKEGKVCGTAYDYITKDGTFIRNLNLALPLKFKIRLDKRIQVYAPGIFVMKKGNYFINDYPTSENIYFSLDGDNTNMSFYGLDIVYYLSKKCSINIFMNKNIDELGSNDIDEFNFKGFNYNYESIKDIEEDFFYVTKSFQTKDGAFLSALPWNMAYVRDNYGLCRGLLATKRYDDVRNLLLFFKNRYLEKNQIATAVSLGNDKTLHIHENDYSENTGYLILLAFEYYKLTNENETFNELLPLLLKAYRGAKELLCEGMMPFSGDETYVACNLIPRVSVDEGSAESTLLFIESTKKMIPYLDEKEAEEANKLVAEATQKYKKNFVKNGIIYANNPSRRLSFNLKSERKGVCPYCYYYGTVYLNKYNLYSCLNCLPKANDIHNEKQFYLTCVSMMPLYIDSDIFSKEELIDIYEDFAKKLISIYREKKRYNERITGYEYGLLLYGLVKMSSPYMHEIYKICLEARDSEKTWSEYYIDGVNTGMRWRTWETGVNMLAIIEYMRYMENENNK